MSLQKEPYSPCLGSQRQTGAHSSMALRITRLLGMVTHTQPQHSEQRGQPGLQSEFQNSQGCYTEKPCLKSPPPPQRKKKKKKAKEEEEEEEESPGQDEDQS